MPVSSFDVMEQFLRDKGYRVGEITGRKYQLVSVESASEGSSPDLQEMAKRSWLLRPRVTNKRATKSVIKAFNDGALDVLVLNRSAAAGVSLHASPRFGDKSRRHLIEHMIPEDPVNRVQLLGRVNRYDQLTSPLITTASTGIYGEVRYLMMQNRKLARMSANVRSSRENAMSIKGVVDLFNGVGTAAVRAYLRDSPLVAKRLGFDADEVEKMPDIVNRTTMRIPLLTISQQRQVYEEIHSRFHEIVQRAEMMGQNPLRPAELDVRAKLASQSLFIGDESPESEQLSSFDSPVYARKITWQETLRPLSWEAVQEAVLAARSRLIERGDIVPEMSDEEMTRINSDAEEFAVADAQQLSQYTLKVSRAHLNRAVVEDVIRGFEGMRRLAHLSSGIEDLVDACAIPSVKRAVVLHEWMKSNLRDIAPGAGLAYLSHEEDAWQRPEYIITDVQIPSERGDLLNPGKWRLTLVHAGAERGQVFSLRSLLSDVDAVVVRGGVTGEPLVHLSARLFTSGMYGNRAARMAHEFALCAIWLAHEECSGLGRESLPCERVGSGRWEGECFGLYR